MIADAAATAARILSMAHRLPLLCIFFDHPIGVVRMSIKHKGCANAAARGLPPHCEGTRARSLRCTLATPGRLSLLGCCFRAARIDESGVARLPLALAAHEIEIAAFVGLQDGLVEQMRIAALRPIPASPAGASAARRFSSSAASTSRSMLRLATSSRIMSPFFTSASGPPTADSGVMCSTMVPNAVPLIRASEIRTMSLTPARAELLRDRQIAGLRHARRALGTGVAQHQHVVGVDVERGIVDPQRHVLDGFEHHGAAGMLQQFRARRRMLDDGAARREIAVQHRHRAFRLDRIVARRGSRPAPAPPRRRRRHRASVAPVMVLASRSIRSPSCAISFGTPPA